MTAQIPGQPPLLGVSDEVVAAVREYASALAELHWQRDQGVGNAVVRAEQSHWQAVETLRQLGFPVDDSW